MPEQILTSHPPLIGLTGDSNGIPTEILNFIEIHEKDVGTSSETVSLP